MEIKRNYNEFEGCYDYRFIDKDKALDIIFAPNLDLYMRLICEEEIPMFQSKIIDFDITKENYEVFTIFENLYKSIIDAKPYGDNELHFDLKRTYEYQSLVNDGVIHWISDDGPKELEDSVKISNIDNEIIRLSFIRNEKPLDFGFKCSHSIAVRFRNSGSTYDPFNCAFMKLYRDIQSIDPEYHQVHFEELKFIKK